VNATPTAIAEREIMLSRPPRGRVGMFGLIATEAAIFTIFVVAYLFYVGKSLTGPMPRDVLSVPIFYTICLLSSSLTIHLAVKALRRGNVRVFGDWWLVTIALGAAFLYSLVGLHGFHVVVGLLALSMVMVFTLLGNVRSEHAERVDVLSLYWHFVDAVWVVVFTVVYVAGR
jgi:cytochrome c oxidase subunit III